MTELGYKAAVYNDDWEIVEEAVDPVIPKNMLVAMVDEATGWTGAFGFGDGHRPVSQIPMIYFLPPNQYT